MRISDWSSDVCSSDLDVGDLVVAVLREGLDLCVHLKAPVICRSPARGGGQPGAVVAWGSTGPGRAGSTVAAPLGGSGILSPFTPCRTQCACRSGQRRPRALPLATSLVAARRSSSRHLAAHGQPDATTLVKAKQRATPVTTGGSP